MTKRTLQGIWTAKHIRDDGRLVSTGDRPADWTRQAVKPGNGSDLGGPHD